MHLGRVTSDGEAILPIVLLGNSAPDQSVDAILDTGFTGSIAIATDFANRLGWTAAGTRRATLADGRVVEVNVFLGRLEWFEESRDVVVLATEGGTLLGMELLWGNRISLDAVEDGIVRVERIAQV